MANLILLVIHFNIILQHDRKTVTSLIILSKGNKRTQPPSLITIVIISHK